MAETNTTVPLEKKQETRKARAVAFQKTIPTNMWLKCQRGFYAQISLISHLRTNQIQHQTMMSWPSSTPKDEQQNFNKNSTKPGLLKLEVATYMGSPSKVFDLKGYK